METKVILDRIESMDRKFDQRFKVMDGKFDRLDQKIDVMAADIIDLKGKVNRLDEKLSVEVSDLADIIRFGHKKIDELLENKVSYDEHNKLAKRVPDIELATA